jgi:tetratricopeptide (TPR) repeat protein/SAM-dependent methyltransferase
MSADLESAGRLFAQGLEQHVAGNWPAAEALYRRALALAPARPSVLFNLGRLALDQKRFGEAEGWLSQAVRAAPDDAEAWCSLGIAHARLGRPQEALEPFDKAIELEPGLAAAYAGRGDALAELMRLDDAVESYARAFLSAPGAHDWRIRFARCAALAPLAAIRAGPLEDATLACLRAEGIDHQQFARAASTLLESRHGGIKRRLKEAAFDVGGLLKAHPEEMRALFVDPLMATSLEQILITDSADEAFFTGLRRGLLQLIESRERAGQDDALAPLVSALACQCFLNEYVWNVTEAETQRVGVLADRVVSAMNMDVPRAPGIEIALLGCYVPLGDVPEIARGLDALQRSAPAHLARVLERQVRHRLQEAEIAAGLERRGRIRDPISLAVMAQYEENPYPRWLTMNRNLPASYVDRIAGWIAPNAPVLAATSATPAILVAGCGTGKGAIGLAQACANSRCLALDLSRASLAYAARMARQLGVANLEFVQGDILDLPDEEAYDLVSCTGVLHHMAEPERGLERLLRTLKPGGYLMVALYSERARRDIVLVRELVARHGLDASAPGIRACRELVRNDPAGRFRALIEEDNDFYSTSMVRDLLFHVQERRYRIPEIEALLDRHRLEFLGFQTPHPAIKNLYRERYAEDPAMLDLGNWDALERDHPRLFRSMYQVWARKPASG